MIESEMEAVLLFKRHERTTWRVEDGMWLIGGKVLDLDLVQRMIDRGIIQAGLFPGPSLAWHGTQYVLAEKFK